MPRRLLARLPIAIGLVSMLWLVPLLAWDAAPSRFPLHSHDALGAGPLFFIAVGYVAQQVVQRPGGIGWMRAGIIVAAFVAWAANQYWPDAGTATLWNDVAVALFVLDIFISIASSGKAPETGLAGKASRSDGPAGETA
jgi:hypothetical protein